VFVISHAYFHFHAARVYCNALSILMIHVFTIYIFIYTHVHRHPFFISSRSRNCFQRVIVLINAQSIFSTASWIPFVKI